MVSQPNQPQNNSAQAAGTALQLCQAMQGSGGAKPAAPGSSGPSAADVDSESGVMSAAPPVSTPDMSTPPATSPVSAAQSQLPDFGSQAFDPLAPPKNNNVTPKNNSIQDYASKLNQSTSGRPQQAGSTAMSALSMCA